MFWTSHRRPTTLSLLTFCLFATVAVAQEAASADEAEPTSAGQTSVLAPLEIKLPRELFVGTPTHIKAPNLDRNTTKRPPYLAPRDATIVSTGKPVTGSDSFLIIGEYSWLTDKDKEGSDGSFIETGPGKQWVQVDLERSTELYAIILWHFHSQGRAYFDVVVQASDDKDFLEGVKILFNNDHDNSSGMGAGKEKEYVDTAEGKLIEATGVKARYLRFYSNGNSSNDLNHYIEIEVWGKPESAPSQ
jgi:hypothetical protein